MKKISTVLAFASFTLLAHQTAFAAAKTVNCQSPMSGYQTSVVGTLNLKAAQNGAFLATGKLTVQMGPVLPRPNPIQVIKVQGQYDKLNGFEYATVGSVSSSDVAMIYISFNDTRDRSDSYIEMRGGARNILNCSRSK